ncbi:MAG: hypothetical protein JNK31_05235, partial [Candidatus Competibacter sp.]|nr:hypothetical protein [Candidatus Competibacter sp.]
MSTIATEMQIALDGTVTRSVARPQSASVQVTDYDNRQTVGKITVDNPKMVCREVNVYYGQKHAIKNVSLDI